MQSTQTLVSPQQPAANAQKSDAGPRPLDPSEFKFVSGGAPKNGWQVTTTATVAGPVAAPKNGW